MNSTLTDVGWQRFILILGGLILIVGALYWAQAVLIPIVLAALITFILTPLVSFLQRRGLGRVPAVLAVVSCTMAFLAGLLFMVLLQVKSLAGTFDQHREGIIQKIDAIRNAGNGSWLERASNTLKEVGQRLKVDAANDPAALPPVPVEVQSSGIASTLQSLASPAVEGLVVAGLVTILVIFMLIQRESLRNRLICLWGRGRLTSMTRAIDDATTRVSRFLLMQLIVNVTFGIALGIGLALIGVPYSILWGFLAAVLRYIPYLGPWIAALLPLTLSIAITPDWTTPILVVVLVLALELLSNNVMEPLLYGQSIGASEVALLISVAFWAWLWGPIGLVLSAPLTACLVVLGRYVPSLEFLSILLGDEPVLEVSASYYQRLLARDEYEATELVEEFAASHNAIEVFDQVLLPALVLTKDARERGDLSSSDEEFVCAETQEIVDDLFPASEKKPREDARPILALGLPAQDRADELALDMFARILDPDKCSLEVMSRQMLVSEMMDRVRKTNPAIILIATLPPRGAGQARYLCKLLRRKFPDLKILVGCWGLSGNRELARRQFTAAGATHVATAMSESRAQLLPLISFLAQAPATAMTPAAHQVVAQE